MVLMQSTGDLGRGGWRNGTKEVCLPQQRHSVISGSSNWPMYGGPTPIAYRVARSEGLGLKILQVALCSPVGPHHLHKLTASRPGVIEASNAGPSTCCWPRTSQTLANHVTCLRAHPDLDTQCCDTADCTQKKSRFLITQDYKWGQKDDLPNLYSRRIILSNWRGFVRTKRNARGNQYWIAYQKLPYLNLLRIS